MTTFKGLNGAFLIAFNIWAAAFCVLHAFSAFSFITFLYGVVTINSSFGLSLAHELIHEKRAFHCWLGELLMLQNGFFYLSYDHIFIHHVHVGTSEDPASARLNENLCAYLRRSLGGRMRMIFTRPAAVRTTTRYKLQQAVRWKLVICAAWLVTALFIHQLFFLLVAAQYIFVILMYETTTYIQHYGLQRQPREKITLQHSWNSYDRLYNYLYYFMPVHSLHHAHATSSTDGSDAGPVMPRRFPEMLFLAFRPAQWFRVMNPLVLKIQEKKTVVSV